VSESDVQIVREALAALTPFGSGGEIATTYADKGNVALARLEARIAALNSENADLNAENTKLLEKWSEAKARDPQQAEYLTSLAKAEARIAELTEDRAEFAEDWRLAVERAEAAEARVLELAGALDEARSERNVAESDAVSLAARVEAGKVLNKIALAVTDEAEGP